MNSTTRRCGGGATALLLVLAACGGRVSHPVEATSPLDDRLSCDHLRAERRVNDARIADLMGEKDNAGLNNAGFLLMSPLFLDVSDTERKEIAAFQRRNQMLDSMIAERCSKPAPS